MPNIFIRFRSRSISCVPAARAYSRTSSPANQSSGLDTNFVRFDKYLERRRNEAANSILVQVSGQASVPDIKSYLTTEFGSLSAMFHYSLPSTSGRGKQITQQPLSGHGSSQRSTSNEIHWILAEFQRQVDYEKAVNSCRFADGALPFFSSMMWFGQMQEKTKSKRSKARQGSTESSSGLPVQESLKPESSIDFSKSKTLSQQIIQLEDAFRVSELGIRVRFLVAAHLELALKSFFPLGVILPFGSTVSGIGRQNGDLDLVLVPNKMEIFPNQVSPETNSRLWCQTKLYTNGSSGNSRFQVQRLMEAIADVIQLFVPGCSNVQRILQARVPILRFWSECLDLQCDLSMTNSSGIHMSELIYIMSSLDNRFPALLCAIRTWAASRKITNPIPGKQPTNFMLVLLLVYYLQSQKVLPTLDVLFNNPGKDDTRITADGIDCTFLREPDKILKFFTPQNSSSSLAELLYGFFEFFSEFDFNSKGISLYTGSSWGKPDSGPMYLQNPLERHLNVSRNVSREEVVRFKNECCAVLWKLETASSNSAASDHGVKQSGCLLQDLFLASASVPHQQQQQSNDAVVRNGVKMKELFSD